MEQMKLTDGITLLSGVVFSYEHPEDSAVTIDDIANPLSNICRYAGQLPYFYSVAQHAVNASYCVPPEHAYTALMHDTAEAFTNDIVTPLKVAVPLFKVLEKRIESAMGQRFGFEYPLPPAVEYADKVMLGLEMKYIRGQDTSQHEVLNGIDYEGFLANVSLFSWSPQQARERFLARYDALRPR